MQVIRQDNPSIDTEWPFGANLPHHGSKQADVPDQQIVRVTFEQVNGEEIASAGYALTSIINWASGFRFRGAITCESVVLSELRPKIGKRCRIASF